MTTTKTCSTCIFWWGSSETKKLSYCKQVHDKGMVDFDRNDDDDDQTYKLVYTSPSFGCILWEPRKLNDNHTDKQ